MLLNELITYFEGVKRMGNNQYTALCPAHDDKTPSLSIGYAENKKQILLHCFAGCKAEDILKRIGLTLNSLYEKGCNSVMTKTKYNYYRADGALAYIKTRTDKEDGSKSFFFEQTNGIKNMQGVQREPYNLPAVLESKKIYFVEGEKCADEVIRHGAVATTLDTGAKSVWHSHYTDYFTNKEVIIIPDNDDAGMQYAKTILKNIPTAKIVVLPDLNTKEDIYDWLHKGHKISEIDELPAYAPDNSSDTDIESTTGKTQAEIIIRLVQEKNTILFHDSVKDPYAAVMVKGHREVWAIDSGDFSLWLNSLYYSLKKKPAKKDSVQQAKEILKAKALFENTEAIPLDTRVAQSDNAFWYNLNNEDGEAVKITENGWEVVNNPPILFKRYRHQNCQYYPNKDGDIRRILKYINLQENHTLFLCWIVSCFIPGFPHAMPIFFGEKGAAKTTTCVLLKKLIDPSSLETLTIQKSSRSLAINLQQHWFLPFDNVSHIDVETSDTLCRAITGGGIQQRRLYSDADDYIFTFQKCLALNGINNVANRPDLLDRAILIELRRIDESCRRELSDLTSKFEEDIPYILGGIFDTLAKAISIYPTVHLDNLPRMADFARWGYAIGQALGDLGNKFLDEYNANQETRNIEILNTDIVATLVVGFMKDKDLWSGLISELHNHLIEIAPQYGISSKSKEFPSVPQILSRRLNNLQSNLKEAGISFTTKSKTHGREITLTNKKISQLSSYHPIVRLESVNNPSIEDVDVDIDENDTNDVEF